MPRKQRIEFPGAVYHVISRGNYRKDLFFDFKSTQAFEKTIFEAVERCEWNLYAYVIMSNHYHLAMETPHPNLVEGMQWLQSTFATRFNRFHGERGHVFQGRYKALVVEPDRSLLGLLDYIHLNPARAGLCQKEHLKQYTFSSYPKFWRRKVRKPLNRKVLLSLLGVEDSIGGMQSYQKHLELSEESDPRNRDKLYRSYCRGWFIGSKKAKQELSEDLNRQHSGVEWEGQDLAELNERKWDSFVREELKKLGKTEKDIEADPKGSPWKMEVARLTRKHTTCKNPWLAKRLNMGHPSRITMAMRQMPKGVKRRK